jgi:hypothetical protein
MVKKVVKSDKEWKKILTPEQFRVLRKSGTERAFTGKYNDHYEKGTYVCAGCGTPPSAWKPNTTMALAGRALWRQLRRAMSNTTMMILF